MQTIEQVVDVAGVVLPVAIDLHGHLIAPFQRVDVAALHRPADAQIERHSQHLGARAPRPLRSGVDRAVVDDQHVEVGRPLVDRRDGSGRRLRPR